MADKQISFKEFCDLCETIQKHPKYPDKERLLTNFINKYKQLEATLLTNQEITVCNFYPVLRLLVPEYERERKPYGLKETALSNLYIRTLGLRGSDANILTNSSNNNNVNKLKNNVDIADVFYTILRKWCANSSRLTIADVNEHLDQLANKHAEHLPREVEKEVSKMTKISTALEQKWIIRIILKNMRLGLGNDRILKVFHPDAPDLFDVSNSIAKICTVLKDHSIRLHELEIELFNPFRPMLSQLCNATVLNKIVKDDKLFYVENKYDGERFQLHMLDGQFKYFSKNGYDYTHTYGGTYSDNGLTTKYLNNAFKNLKSVILDGEMMLWSKKTNSFGSKGMMHDVKKLKNDSNYRPCYCVFDVLLHNGRVLTNEPLIVRLNILDKLFDPIEGVLMKSPRFEIRNKQELLDELNRSADRKEEGICFKDPNSVYKPHDRKAGWWKLKLEYFDGLMKELDVLIIGAYYGDGNQRISSFLMGVAEKSATGGTPNRFHSFVRASNGMTNEEFGKLLNFIQPHLKPFNKNDVPEYLVIKREKPDLWIEPRKSCILQIKASELAYTTDFATNYTLRFPRVEQIRYEKPWYDCLTLDELDELTKNNQAIEKLNSRHITENDIQLSPDAKRARKSTAIQRSELLSYLTNVEVKSNLLVGKEFCVFTGNEQHTKNSVEVRIKEFGGKVVQYAGPNTTCTLIGDETPQTKYLISTSTSDIVKLKWLINLFKKPSTKRLELTPNDFIVLSKKTKISLSNRFDKYGDSYTKQITKESLSTILENVTKEGDYLNLMPSELTDFDKELSFNNKLGLFRYCFVHFDPKNDQNQCNNLINNFLFYGGTKCESISEFTTHIVILYECDETRLKKINNMKAEANNEIAKIVYAIWIEECLNLNKIVPEEPFSVV